MGENERTVWDGLKNERNIDRHGIDFTDLDEAFDGRFSFTREDRRRDYGEQRFNMLVMVNGLVLNITFTPRGGKQRIVSARPASRRERKVYDAQR